jgi:hydrogenase maturation protease
MLEKHAMISNSQNNMEALPRIVIIGVGNLLMKDEGIGIHAIQALQEMDLPSDVKLVDGGTSPDLIAYTRVGDKLIIIDAAKAGGEPGVIYRFKPEDILAEKGTLSSAHELGVIESLNMVTFTGNKPSDVVIIGMEPAEIDWGMELSPLMQQKLPAIVQVVLKEINSD